MTVYVISDAYGEILEVFALEADAIARLHDIYIQACADPCITEQVWDDEDGFSCSWFDARIGCDTEAVTIEAVEVQ